MTKYKVTFFFERGVTLVAQFEHESKHFEVEAFDTTLDELADRLGAFQWVKE